MLRIANRIAQCTLVLTVALVMAAGLARANTITVNTTADEVTPGDSQCSLREAINNANSASDTTSGDCAAGTGNDTINFNVSGVIVLTDFLPGIANTLTISGSSQTVRIDGAGLYRVLTVNTGATLSLTDITIANGKINTDGGGVYNAGTLNVTDSTFTGNSAVVGEGGAILTDGPLTIVRSTFSGNTAYQGSGGALFTTNKGHPVVITNSTFSRNTAGAIGGAIFAPFGGPTVLNSTISGNNSGQPGGGIGSVGATLTGSILSNNTGGNCSGPFPVTNGGYNIADDATCGFGSSVGDNGQTLGDNVNPLLDAAGLQNNGGLTQTIALQPSSPAVDAVPVADCPATDQRGITRPDSGESACDIGAYEFVDFAGTPGTKNCVGDSISVLAQRYGGLNAAAAALLFQSVQMLQTAVKAYCAG